MLVDQEMLRRALLVQQGVTIRQQEDAEVIVVIGQLRGAQLDFIKHQAKQLVGFGQQELVVFKHFKEGPTMQEAIAEHLVRAQQLAQPWDQPQAFLKLSFLQEAFLNEPYPQHSSCLIKP